MDPFNPYAGMQQQAGQQYAYQDDGLGGLGDDGLGGLGGGYTAPPEEEQEPLQDDALLMYPDDGLQAYSPPQDAAAVGDGGGPGAGDGTPGGGGGGEGLDDELGDALDKAFEQAAAGGTKTQDDDEDDDEMTEDEVLGASEDEQVDAADAQAEDPALAEQQRQNLWARECFDAMTEAQRNRLEAYNRSSLQKKTMKKVVQELTGAAAANDRLLIALCSVTKMFVGELVETGRQIAAHEGYTGPLLPRHIRAAHLAMSEDNRVPRRAPSKPLRLH